MNRILFVLFGYLIGSLNFGLIVPEIKHKKDIRKYGSGNAGATNAYRLFGFVTGLTVLFLDSGKAVIYLLLIKKYAQYGGLFSLYLAGLATVVGHIFPIWFHFRGGKGVATALGMLIVVCPKSLIMLLPAFAAVLLLTKDAGAASVTAAILMPFSVYVFSSPNTESPYNIITVCVIISLIVIFSHRSNIKEMFSQ